MDYVMPLFKKMVINFEFIDSSWGDYVYLQQTSPIMLNVSMGQACKTLSQKWWWKQLRIEILLM